MGRDERTVVVRDAADLARPATRRDFLRALGLGGTAVLLPAVFAACSENDVASGLAPATASADVTGAALAGFRASAPSATEFIRAADCEICEARRNFGLSFVHTAN